MKVKSQLIDAQLEARNGNPTKRGEIVYHTGDDEVKYGDGSGTKTVVTTDDTQTLTNKTLTAPVLNGDLSAGSGVLDEDDMSSDSATAVPTQQSVKAYVDTQVAGKDAADEISYDNSTSGLTATDVQAAIDEVEGRVDTAESGKVALSTFTTKGDLIAATASATIARLGVGSDGQYLTAASGEATGLQWTSPGAAALAVTTKANADSPYTVTTSDDVILANTAAGDVELDLPTAVGNTGKRFIIKIIDATNECIIDGNGSETVDGEANFYLSRGGEFVEIISDGSNWRVIASKLCAYEEGVCSGSVTTSTGGTEIDVTGASITLHPGTWEIGYKVDWRIREQAGALSNIQGRVRVTNSSNTYLDQTASYFGGRLTSGEDLYGVATNFTQVTISSSTTYKLRLECNESAANGDASVFFDGSINASIGGDDVHSKIWAKRVL